MNGYLISCKKMENEIPKVIALLEVQKKKDKIRFQRRVISQTVLVSFVLGIAFMGFKTFRNKS